MKKTKNIIIIPIIFFIVNSYNKNIDLADDNQKIEEILSKDTGTLILNYHTLNDDETSYNLNENMQVYNMSLSGFEEQINFIIEKNINVITLDELREEIENDSFLEKNIFITFDDIDETVYENAYPILKKNNIPFSLFIVTSTPGTTFDERKYASW